MAADQEKTTRRLPEGVDENWHTKQQAMRLADIRSDYMFRQLADLAKQKHPAGMIETGKNRPTWISPEFLQELIALNSTPEAGPNMISAKELVKMIRCGSDDLDRWLELFPPSASETALRRAKNGHISDHFKEEYADALRAFKDSSVLPREPRVDSVIQRARQRHAKSDAIQPTELRVGEAVVETPQVEYRTPPEVKQGMLERCRTAIEQLQAVRVEPSNRKLRDAKAALLFRLEGHLQSLQRGEEPSVQLSADLIKQSRFGYDQDDD